MIVLPESCVVDEMMKREELAVSGWDDISKKRNETKTYGLASILDPLPQLNTGDLGRRGVFHQKVDGNTSVPRDPGGAVR